MKLNNAIINGIIRDYPDTKNNEICTRYNISRGTLYRVAKKNGLRKTDEFMRWANQENARRTHNFSKVCDSLAKMKEMKKAAGTPVGFKPGITNLMRLGYDREMERRNKVKATKANTIQSEKRRLMWGLPQKTKLKLVISDKKERKCCYKIRERLRLSNYHFGIGSKTIYYDDSTVRSLRKENFAIKHGFKFFDSSNPSNPTVFILPDWHDATQTDYFSTTY